MKINISQIHDSLAHSSLQEEADLRGFVLVLLIRSCTRMIRFSVVICSQAPLAPWVPI